MRKEASPEKVVQEIRRKTRRQFSDPFQRPSKSDCRNRRHRVRRISRLEVAAFLVGELEENRYVRQAVFIGHE